MSAAKVTPLARRATPGVLPEDRMFWFRSSGKWLYLRNVLKVIWNQWLVCCILRYVNPFQLQLFYCMLALPCANKAHLYWHLMIYW